MLREPPKKVPLTTANDPGRAGTPAHSSINGAAGHPTDSDASEAIIAVMGGTGCGKSTFINLISGSNLEIGSGLRSCTSTVQPSGSFDLGGRRILLIDTPGFDDTTRSDTDILKTIAALLETLYERNYKLTGVLYFHRISDFRMGGASTKNFKMFRKLCGNDALKNVVIVTNMWGEIDPEVGDAREVELREDELFFKPALERGATMVRHDGALPTAQAIIHCVLENTPLPLLIQSELVDEGKDISETSAGEELKRGYAAVAKKHEGEMGKLKREMEEAMREKDEETRRELEIEAKRIQKEMERIQNDTKRLGSEYKTEKGRLDAQLTQAQMASQEAVRNQQGIDGLRRTRSYQNIQEWGLDFIITAVGATMGAIAGATIGMPIAGASAGIALGATASKRISHSFR